VEREAGKRCVAEGGKEARGPCLQGPGCQQLAGEDKGCGEGKREREASGEQAC